jgi:ABC-type nitrate/sulfonate/bicarbonate transport system substrate-binding protein
MKKSIIYTLTVLILVIVGCKSESKTESGLAKVTLRQEWFANASYLGEVMAINETDSINGLEIELIEGAEDIDPLKMIISGQNDFGVAGADRLFEANEKGANLVVIGVVNHINPTCFISLKTTELNNPEDFKGKKVGVFTGNNTEMIYRLLIKKANIDVSKIEEVEAPFDLGTFITRNYDIRPAYIFDETVSLDLQNIEYNILKPQDYGVTFVGNVYFTSRKMVENNPEIVRKFVKSITEGWEATYKDVDKAVKYLKEFSDGINIEREIKSFNNGKEYFRDETGRVLFSDFKNWQMMEDDLKALGKIKNSSFKDFVNYNFLIKDD